ncbi:MAG: recombinase RecT, partial [Gemmatimonadaceae bacterium]|nr:recombinase RecT [Gemmatimonadaceae bacterium]
MVNTLSSGEIVKRGAVTDKVEAWVNNPTFQARIKDMLPSIIKPERFAAVALTSLSRNPRLLECTPVSLIRCLLQAATVGLEV